MTERGAAMPERWKTVLLWTLVVLFSLASVWVRDEGIKSLARFAGTLLLVYNISRIRLRKR